MFRRTLLYVAVLTLAGLSSSCGGSDLVDAAASSAGDAIEAAGESEGESDSGFTLPPITGPGPLGKATVDVDGVTYEFSGKPCLAELEEESVTDDVFNVSGFGIANGEQFYAYLIRRDASLTNDDAQLVYLFIEVGVERTDRQAPPEKPSLLMQFEHLPDDPSITYEPGKLDGTGVVMDRNGVLAGIADEIPVTFSATCS